MKSHTFAKALFSIIVACIAIFMLLVWYASRTIEQEALAGDSEAQYLLALKLIDQSHHAEALSWIQRAAEAGHVPAQVILGNLYLTGQGVTQDYLRARHWFEIAANDYHPIALLRLGEVYRDGLGLPPNRAQAISYFQQAAKEGSLEAKLSLASLLISRPGKEAQQGLELYQSLAEAGQTDAMIALAEFHARQRNYRQSCDWYEAAASQQHAQSTYKLALCYYDGLGRKKDFNEFFQLITKAANYGLADAQLLTGDAFALGLGTEVDRALAIDWYLKAADQGAALAQYKLAKQLLDAGDESSAEVHLAQSAAQEFAPAQYELAMILKQRASQEGWDHVAVLFEKAARNGHNQAQFELGQLYAKGLGLVVDLEQARHWFSQSAQNGYPEAKKALEELASFSSLHAH